MSRYRFRFDDHDGWQAPIEGIRTNLRSNGPASLRFIELRSSASHPEWCHVGHSGCVLEGALEVEFEGEVVRFESGDGILIPPGAGHQHRPRAVTERVRLAVVDIPE